MSEKEPHESAHLAGVATAALPRDQHPHGHGKAGRSGPPGNGNARKHGTHSLKQAVKALGCRAIDRRTTIGKALAARRSELLTDLGGIGAVSTQELALVEEAVKTSRARRALAHNGVKWRT